MRYLVLALCAAASWMSAPTLALAAPASAAPASAGSAAPVPDPDYAAPASWACRPGAETACTSGLDAIAISPDGHRRPDPFVAAANPAIDCFYVYPTASHEQSDYSDLAPSPEVMHAIRGQAGRLASQCRLYAPFYRQATLPHLRRKMAGGGAISWDGPYRDVVAAWQYYLAHDNHGRGVVLVGHSQGTILLQRLIQEHIDGQPAQRLLVSAYLAGDPGLAVPAGGVMGGTFAHIPTCAAVGQTGCVYVWSSYLADDTAAARVFGHNPANAPAMVAACVNPAAPQGGRALLKSFLPKPAMAPAGDPDWIVAENQMSAICAADAQGNVLRVTVEPGRYADLLQAKLSGMAHDGWGTHGLDVGLVQGNMIGAIGAQATQWARTHP